MPRFLIVRLGALGDIVHALPVVAALDRRWPDAKIDWVVEARHAALLDFVPRLDRRIVIDTRRPTGSNSWLAAVTALRHVTYDAVLDVQGLVKSAVMARSARAVHTLGFSTSQLREPLARFFYSKQVDPGPVTHVAHRNLGLLRGLGIDAPALEFPLAVPTPSPASQTGALIAETLGRLALVNPGAAWPNKRWPPERFGALASRIGERHALEVVVPWGPGERDLAASVVAASENRARLAPETTLADLMALVHASDLVVSGDTGPLHLAAAYGRPVVGIFGPTNPVRNGPWSEDDESVSRSDVCECSHKRTCGALRWCLLDVSVEEVSAAVDRRLARLAR